MRGKFERQMLAEQEEGCGSWPELKSNTKDETTCQVKPSSRKGQMFAAKGESVFPLFWYIFLFKKKIEVA